MKKYIKAGILILTIISVMTMVTGCTKKEKKKKKEELSTIELKDKRTGYKTTFNYPKKENYKITNEDQDSGAFVSLTIENEDKNISWEMYYFNTTDTSYNNGKQNRQEIDEKNSYFFKEYKWNGYEGYAYNGTGSQINFNILLKSSDDEKDSIAIFGTIYTIKTEDTNVTEIFKSKEFQKILNTVKFKEK